MRSIRRPFASMKSNTDMLHLLFSMSTNTPESSIDVCVVDESIYFIDSKVIIIVIPAYVCVRFVSAHVSKRVLIDHNRVSL
jgi:hypothetical protein